MNYLCNIIEKKLHNEVLANTIRHAYGLKVINQPSPCSPLTDDSDLDMESVSQVVKSLPLSKVKDDREMWEHFAIKAGLKEDDITLIKADHPQSHQGRIESLVYSMTMNAHWTWNSLKKLALELDLDEPRRPSQATVYQSLNRPADDEELFYELKKGLANGWKSFGRQVGISTGTINYIASNNQQDALNAVREVACEYMKRSSACWEQVCDALDRVDQKVLAASLRAKYCTKKP